jgi:hypothetical protein
MQRDGAAPVRIEQVNARHGICGVIAMPWRSQAPVSEAARVSIIASTVPPQTKWRAGEEEEYRM